MGLIFHGICLKSSTDYESLFDLLTQSVEGEETSRNWELEALQSSKKLGISKSRNTSLKCERLTDSISTDSDDIWRPTTIPSRSPADLSVAHARSVVPAFNLQRWSLTTRGRRSPISHRRWLCCCFSSSSTVCWLPVCFVVTGDGMRKKREETGRGEKKREERGDRENP
ncbi:hypothetical protein Dimus_038224 [Dionaea muscipula]